MCKKLSLYSSNLQNSVDDKNTIMNISIPKMSANEEKAKKSVYISSVYIFMVLYMYIRRDFCKKINLKKKI